MLLEKNAKQIEDKLDNLANLYERTKSIIGDEDYENSEKFKQFLDNITKKNDLEVFDSNELKWYICLYIEDNLRKSRDN